MDMNSIIVALLMWILWKINIKCTCISKRRVCAHYLNNRKQSRKQSKLDVPHSMDRAHVNQNQKWHIKLFIARATCSVQIENDETTVYVTLILALNVSVVSCITSDTVPDRNTIFSHTEAVFEDYSIMEDEFGNF